jgi:hypothetical protein
LFTSSAFRSARQASLGGHVLERPDDQEVLGQHARQGDADGWWISSASHRAAIQTPGPVGEQDGAVVTWGTEAFHPTHEARLVLLPLDVHLPPPTAVFDIGVELEASIEHSKRLGAAGSVGMKT